METFALCASIIFVGSLFAVLIYSVRQGEKRDRVAWQKFADEHQLPLLGSREIGGSYRGYRLSIDEIKQGNHSQIRMTISLSESDLPNLLPTNPTSSAKSQMIENNITQLIQAAKPCQPLRTQLSFALQGRSITAKFPSFGQSLDAILSNFDRLRNLLDAYIAVGKLGSAAIPALAKMAPPSNNILEHANPNLLQAIAIALITDIARETEIDIGHRYTKLRCSRCAVRFAKYEVQFSPFNTVTYYGCRACHQSHDFFTGSIVALLDRTVETAQLSHNNILQINWLIRRQLFDFDEVHILNATDEEVERFAVQVGNDTDEVRQPGYAKMRCVVAPECELSLNTMRILERTFGQVSLARGE